MPKKFLALAAIVVSSALLFGGCQESNQTTPTGSPTESSERPTTTISGKIVKTGNTFTIVTGAKATAITSKKINLGSYNLKEVQVSGEFSGTTLYVDSIK